jgi:hypothetical protein
VIGSDATLADLHVEIQAAFGWYGYHLHEFEIDDVRYGPGVFRLTASVL